MEVYHRSWADLITTTTVLQPENAEFLQEFGKHSDATATMNLLTIAALRTTWRGKDKWISDGGARGVGRLIARITRDGADFYYQYFAEDGRRRLLPLGPCDVQGLRGLSLPKARDRAAELSAIYRSGTTDLHAHFERQRLQEERARRAEEEAARRALDDAHRSTLKELLDLYVGHLERLGKQSARDVRSIFETHIVEAAPELLSRKAAAVPVDDFVGLIGAVVEAGKGRTASKLRSYLRAAYSLAIRSKTDPSAPMALRNFGISANPIAGIGALSRFNRARDRDLSAPELAALLKRLDALSEGAKKDAVQLCVLLGGQRPAQLLRARPADVDLSAGVLTLFDGKGARQQPRVHVVPLTRPALEIVRRRVDESRRLGGAPLFTSDGRSTIRPETVSVLVAEISAKMVEAEEARESFGLRDLRRTAETMLASLGVPSDVRAHLQSHGLGGVQKRHYDRHEYALEKRSALELWVAHLERLRAGKTASVVPIGHRRARRGQPGSLGWPTKDTH
jgi:integrase